MTDMQHVITVRGGNSETPETKNLRNSETAKSTVRSSNLELYRIICMLLIVAHHFVVNSGLTAEGGPLQTNPDSSNTLFLYLFGMWGKTGINCFIMITGYFMCKSKISIRKFLKLMLWIYVYNVVIFGIFLSTGYESLRPLSILQLLMPVWGFNTNFTSCFIGFWLTIPFWNILIQNMTKHQHRLLLLLLVGMYSVLGNIPRFDVSMNYVTWFGVIYIIASYIRLYPLPLYERKNVWASLSLIAIIMAMLSVLITHHLGHGEYFFLVESNKFLSVAVAVTTFLWFKNINIPYSKLINAIGGSTFGVLCIHANSDAMRQWLWKDIVDCVGHYSLPFWQLVGFSIGAVLTIFFTCIIIDRIRIKLLEEPFFKWYDKKTRFQRLTNLLTKE